ncbi:alpha-galactosidase [Carnobacterium viridans]|uniref:Alpha-galactosidase n=2 Tax=Carnobacterium viridans TaxID=174587 RepID=A0A1H0XIB5_9LACT|nr:alpha-galactosidase [Carnobacterium viridans]
MSQLIHYDEEKKVFHLTNTYVSYIMEIVEDTYLIHRHWGKKLTHYNFSNRPKLKKRTFAATPNVLKPELSLEFLPQEISLPHQGDFRNSAVKIQNQNGQSISRFSYVGYEIHDQAIELQDLPFARSNESFGQTLIIHLYDKIAKITLDLFYTIFEDSPIIVRSTKVINESTQIVKIDKLLSASLDTHYDNQLLTTFYGTHQKEFQMTRSDIQHGLFKIGSTRGASGPQYPPFLALSKDATEFQGEVHALTLLYSGNHEENIERDQYNNLRVQIGINEETFSWTLNPKEAIQSPQALLVYGSQGFNSNSQAFHTFFNNHLINPLWKKRKRPIVINSWEMTYFNVSERLLLEMIDSASSLGFETVVLDDGWFGKRNSSKTSLGDWTIDEEKFPNGIKPLVDYAKEKKIGFGIWFEPEMISPNTDLIAQHPDWVMKSKSYEPILGRNQLFLDLTNKEVQDFIIKTLSDTITSLGVNYIKWDMNRHMTDPFSPTKMENHSIDFSHRYMLGLYHIVNTLTSKHSDVLFENCSSGGGRLDPGMLFYFPQTWISDNTDALDRQQIQYGASYMFPIASMTGHVSEVPNHQTGRKIAFETRAALASSTNMGYEMDIINMSGKERQKVANHLSTYKKERDLIFEGDFYRLSSPNESNMCGWMFVDEKKNNAIIYVFRNIYEVFDLSLLIRIPYLDTEANYLEMNTNTVYSGSELSACGISLENPPGDFIVHKLILEKVTD